MLFNPEYSNNFGGAIRRITPKFYRRGRDGKRAKFALLRSQKRAERKARRLKDSLRRAR